MQFIILDKQFKNVAVVDEYKSLIWTDRCKKCGDFEIELPVTKTNLEMYQLDYYIWSSETKRLMIIEDRKVKSDLEDGDKLYITGRSIESILERRILARQTNINGDFQNQIEKIFNENILSPTDAKRKIQNFVFIKSTDPAIADLTIDAQYTEEDIYEIITKNVETMDICFQMTLNDQNQFEFSFYQGVDRSYAQDVNPHVVFSYKFDNLLSTNYLQSNSKYRNMLTVAGEGEGDARKKVLVGDTNLTGLDRRELFVNAASVRSTDMSAAQYENALIQKGKEELEKNKLVQTLDGEVDVNNDLYKYNRDFFMGDWVTIESSYGITTKAQVVEFIISDDGNGIKMYPTFNVKEEV